MHLNSDMNTTTRVVLLADGSLESTVLAYAYAEKAYPKGQLSCLTLVVPTYNGIPRGKNHALLQNLLQARYPTLMIEQKAGDRFPRFLFNSLHFQKHIAHFLRLVRDTHQYGNTLLAPVYDDGHFPGVSSPCEVIDTVNTWFKHFPVPPLQIITPFQAKTTEAIARLGIELGVDLNSTFDCEEPIGQEHCYICRRCVDRYHALESINARVRNIN